MYNFLQDNFLGVFQEYMYEGQRPHELKAISVQNPIVIIREPYERIFSVYRYWRAGSEIYGRKSNESKPELSFSEFLDEINIFNIWSSYVGAEHLLPQSCWLEPAAYSKAIVIKYRKDLSASMSSLLDYLRLSVPDRVVPKMNVTLDYSQIEISQNEKQKIIDRYWCDFVLWHDLNNNKEKFKKVI